MSGAENPANVGDRGEDYIESLCQLPLGADFLFRGPKYLTKNGHRELCDLFVLIGSTAILIEIKTSDEAKATTRTESQWVEYANSKLEKTIQQHTAGIRAIREGSIKEVSNERQGTVALNESMIDKIYCISVVDHPTLDKWGGSPVVEFNGESASVMTTTHQELREVFQELSTPRDLVEYLSAREKFFSKHTLMGITELDLLAFYKLDPSDFIRKIDDADRLIVADGYWEDYSRHERRIKRSQEDVPSYIVDDLINALHYCDGTGVPHLDKIANDHEMSPPSSSYEPIATQLAMLGRVMRRIAGKKLLALSEACKAEGRYRYFAIQGKSKDCSVIIFLVSEESREERAKNLMYLAQSALYHFQNRPVVVVGIPPVEQGKGFNVDAMLVDQPYDYVRENLPNDLVDLLPKFGQATKPDVSEFDS